MGPGRSIALIVTGFIRRALQGKKGVLKRFRLFVALTCIPESMEPEHSIHLRYGEETCLLYQDMGRSKSRLM